MRVRALTTALLFASVTAGGAQQAGSFEITGFGRYNAYDNTLGIEQGPSGGGSLGFYPIANLAIEAEGVYTDGQSNLTGNQVVNVPLRGRLTYHLPFGGYSSALRVGAGYVRNLYRGSEHFNDNGMTGVVGLRLGLSPSLGLRVDGTADYVRSPDAGRTDQYLNLGVQAGIGLQLALRSGSPKDRDKDGVIDSRDSCPNTVAGNAADLNGCAANQRDSDRDVINDTADRCPNTASDESVDASGCSDNQRDDDRDGVVNAGDKCPRTAAGENPNSSGCAGSQRDDDHDGVTDATDECPNTPAGNRVNSKGCPVERDSDGDNVPDNRDRCPNTPAGVSADANGCTIAVADERDTDADGVADRLDRCPGTAKDDAADAKGCTILFQKGKRSVVLQGVTFQSGSATLTPTAQEILTDIASQLVENPQYRVQVSGHSDSQGSRAANLRLSLARAQSVEAFLEANSVPPAQVTAKGFGPDVPLTTNATAAGRARNRRVELNRTN